MPEPTSEALLLLAALGCSTVGMAWLALAMDVHWQQAKAGVAGRGTVLVLRVLGTLALLASLLFCLRADHASMAALMWVMALAASALGVAFMLAWRPRALAVLVAWLG